MSHPDPELTKLRFLFHNQAFAEALRSLELMPPAATSAGREEMERLKGWAHLAMGETEEAYRLFCRCSDHAGGQAGILILTVLAGQMAAAMQRWQHLIVCAPPLVLPDADWHARPVVMAAIAQIQRYPFPERSLQRGAAGLYAALLFRALGEAPSAFIELSKVVDFYPPADLVRDRWLEQVVCLPPPSNPDASSEPEAAGSAQMAGPAELPRIGLGDKESAVMIASRLLLYPDPDILERQYKQALEHAQWQDALEMLDRLLLFSPNHTGGLETRWRLYLQLGWPEAAKSDLFALVDIYERENNILACQQAAKRMVEQFPTDERALLKMCFLQSRLGAPLCLAHYGKLLLRLCREQELFDRFATYRLWLLRQELSLDDRSHFESLGSGM